MRPALLALALLLAACSDDDSTVETDAETTTTNPCSALRDDLKEAKQARNEDGLSGSGDDEQRAAVDKAARAARQAGCDIDDLVGPGVGA